MLKGMYMDERSDYRCGYPDNLWKLGSCVCINEVMRISMGDIRGDIPPMVSPCILQRLKVPKSRNIFPPVESEY